MRRVPLEFAALDRRGIVRVTTEIAVVDDPRGVHAREVVHRLNSELEAYWRGLRDGQSAEARIRFEAASRRARALGLTYRTNEELADGPRDEILRRLQLLIDRQAVDDESEVAAVMGGETKPGIRLSGLLEEYEAIESSSLLLMSPNQQRKWRNPKKRAVADLIEVVGDKEVTALTRDDAIGYRRHWQARIAAEGLDIGTANKNIGRLSRMLTIVDRFHQLGTSPVFKELRLAGQVARQRAAFDAAYVQDHLLADGALATLNAEARHIFYLIADTGLRISEACNLMPATIRLDHKVPHVQIRADGRVLKTDHSARDMPLVGCALAVMRLHPEGFPRYRDKPDSLSAIVNKVLEGKKLLPTPEHSVYSLRHSFEDRLTAIEAPEKVVASLMGHKWIRPKYGAGPSLEQKRDWLAKIAFMPPAHL
ncbi:MAG: integrase [Devosia sp.]|nr:integrase [Devosia sp.]